MDRCCAGIRTLGRCFVGVKPRGIWRLVIDRLVVYDGIGIRTVLTETDVFVWKDELKGCMSGGLCEDRCGVTDKYRKGFV